uniref:Cytoskeleton-associated protein 2 C-terminal domain-containing protein n=1 Tax=Heliothis virescens TaxID=7102 RepID=A0A2A4JX09_HELVI
MDPVADRLNKLREERIAREKARIEKLRELNLKKYNRDGESTRNSTTNLSMVNKSVKSEVNFKNPGPVKNNFHVNGTSKRPISVPTLKKDLIKPKSTINQTDGKARMSTIPKAIEKKNFTGTTTNKNIPNIDKKPANVSNADRKNITDKKVQNDAKKPSQVSNVPKFEKKLNTTAANNMKKQHFPIRKADSVTANVKLRQSLAVTNNNPKTNIGRKSMIPQSASKSTSQVSVFERLYKPKTAPQTHLNDVEKLQTDPNYLKKVIRNSGIILNKRHTVFENTKPKIAVPVRRSISAVHFKRIGKEELGNCIHKWASIGDKLNNVHLKHVNEDENIQEDRVVSAIKSERKKVKFMTPMGNLNTPRPEELQARLKSWLQKRGKSLDSYHHLQCFGIHHLPHNIKFDPKVFDEENKENIAVESDSDDDSYTENMNEGHEATEKWRTASVVSDSVDFNESQNTTVTCSDVVNVDDVVVGALNDLTEILREGFDWEQCARWLRAIRERFPSAPQSAAYWECRAALEERRGDLPASVQCWEEAIAKGTEHSVVEANLDQLLDKFMQLKISPSSGKRREADPKLVDVKNVFKSTIIRFAVQQAKLRQSNQFEVPKYTVTPVRRSARLSAHWSARRTPLQVCTTVRQADEILGEKPVFIPNGNLYGSP